MRMKSTSVLFYFALVTLAFLCISDAYSKKASAQSTGEAGADPVLRPSTSFSNTTPITIVDAASASLYPSQITVSGVSGNIPLAAGSVKVTLNGFSHSFPDDVGIVLVGPTGAALLLQDGAGDDPDMVNVTYSLSDLGPVILPNATAWAAGTYKPTTHYTGDSFPAPGPGTVYGNPGPAGAGTATFSSTFGGTNPNGTWSLFIVDYTGGDSGLIAGGWTLDLTSGIAAQHVVDFNGDGKTDYSIVRQASVSPDAQSTWYNCLNGIAAPGCLQAAQFGKGDDFFVPADYDGDSKSDIAVWRMGAPDVAGFYVLKSSTSTYYFDPFGQTNDDPTVTADYTGDGKADPAVYRYGINPGDQSFFYYRASSGPFAGQIVYEPWGKNNGATLLGDYPAPGDYDGDGKADFMVERNDGTGHAVFWLRTNGTNNISTVVFGLSGDFNTPGDLVVPGDYDGDGKTDIALVRGVNGAINWYVRRSSNPSLYPLLATFGLSASDYPVQGDYDGDGITDVAVWRPSTTDQSANYFHVLGSMSGYKAFQWGQCLPGPPVNCDYPTANFNTH